MVVGLFKGTFSCRTCYSLYSIRSRIDDVFSLWEKGIETINRFVLEANTHHPTIKFTAEISEKETPFLETTIFTGERFYEDAIVHIRTHFKPTETFQYTHFTSCHALVVKKGFKKII